MSHHEVLTADSSREKLIAILRGVPMEKLDGVVEALAAGGVRILEFTFDHDGDGLPAARTRRRFATRLKNTASSMLVGCGTALTVQEVEAACDAGACLVISPNVDYGVIRRTRQLGMVSMPGALTPTEIVAAHGAGADIVKLFPAGTLGVDYIKAVRGPLGYIDMSAVGGVKPENVEQFLDARRLRLRRGRSARARLPL